MYVPIIGFKYYILFLVNSTHIMKSFYIIGFKYFILFLVNSRHIMKSFYTIISLH